MSQLSLRGQVGEDWRTHRRRALSPGFHALLVHRVSVWGRSQPRPVRRIVRILTGVVNAALIRNVYGMELYPTTVIGRRVRIGHHMGVVLGKYAVIGDDVLIRQHVTLGRSAHVGPDLQPTIGNGVQLGAGAIVLGGVTIGDGARIGPGAVVMTDVPAGASAFAPPARILKPTAPAAQPVQAGPAA